MKGPASAADKSSTRWPWHLCGALAALYVVDFWASVGIPQVSWMNSEGPLVLAGCWQSDRRWWPLWRPKSGIW